MCWENLSKSEEGIPDHHFPEILRFTRGFVILENLSKQIAESKILSSVDMQKSMVKHPSNNPTTDID